ncbi:YcaO-like family protein [Agrobacterium vaccinii]|uniref:YcaO-like family protein n=1 Tax=Agrobacterium vaccinii TaxID=2735528 RepID=UPI001E619131|nr:YcaO-like family protein [Agrobacterium vaccinii]UHS59080.1 YcaO-like family protein [Agrobacterium vaccinii]UHS63587.1 YcaO-like family protein [Agrobacterium vaccinii]
MQLDNYRACSPGETLTRVSPFLARLGITRLARQTGLDDIGIAVWCAFAPNAKAIVIAQGKGIDDEAARTSAAMEAIERSIATNPTCHHRIATRQTVEDAGDAVDTLTILLSPHAPPITTTEHIDWVRAGNLLTGEPIWLPYDAVHLDRTLASPRYWQSSDGLASGNTRDEALLHAVLERVERDALTLWQMTPVAKRYRAAIDTASISQPALQNALGLVAQAGLEIALFDITTDLAIPCVVALLGPQDRKMASTVRHVDLTYGAGAATTPAVAAMRAITEAAQSRMTFIAGARDDLLPDIFSQSVDTSMLQAMDVQPSKSLGDLPTLDAASTEHSLETVLDRLQTAGIDKLYAVDLAPEWLPAAVVKVFAPQLENPDGERHRRFGPRALSRAL